MWRVRNKDRLERPQNWYRVDLLAASAFPTPVQPVVHVHKEAG